MDSHTMVLLIVLASIGGGVVMKYLKLRGRGGPALSRQEAAMLDGMSQTAARLEQRVMTLERILDDQVPAWRTTELGVGR